MRLFPTKKITASFLLLVFLIQVCLEGHAQIPYSSGSEIRAKIPFSLELDPKIAKIESIYSGTGPALVHIQAAHGNYELQKQIESILLELKNKYGITTVLAEGTASSLDPALLKFAADKEINLQIMDDLARKGMIKGAEFFMLQDPANKVRGIEELGAYAANGQAFLTVMSLREKTAPVVAGIEAQLEKQAGKELNPELRKFWKKMQAFEAQKTVSLGDWISELCVQAGEVLDKDLSNPRFQLDWPMMVRLLTLERIEKKIDLRQLESEKAGFYRNSAALPADLFTEVRALLDLPMSHNQLSDPETSELFERMAARLPAGFRFEDYPNLSLWIGHLILQSEIKPEILFEETERLALKVIEKRTKNSGEKELLSLIRDFDLFKKLLNLELTPRDLGRVPSPERFPFKAMRELLEVDKEARKFYALALKRDEIMSARVEDYFRSTGETKAAVITGGFHAQAMRRYFESRDYSYALLLPQFSTIDAKSLYSDAMRLKGFDFISVATVEEPFLSDPLLKIRPELRRFLDTAVADRVGARSESRALGSESISWEEAKTRIRTYVNAVRSGRGIEPAKKQLLEMKRFNAGITVARALLFPKFDGGSVPAINRIPVEMDSVPVEVMEYRDEICLKIIISSTDVRYLAFQPTEKKYLASRIEPGIREIREYAIALRTGNATAIATARENLLKYRSGFKVFATEGGEVKEPKMVFPIIGKATANFSLPDGTKEIEIRVIEEDGVIYLELTPDKNGEPFRLEFSKGSEKQYLATSLGKALREIRNYFIAYLENDKVKLADARKNLKPFMNGFDVRVSKGTIYLPKIKLKNGSIRALPLDIEKAKIFILEDEEEIYLKAVITENDIRYYGPEKEGRYYLRSLRAKNDDEALRSLIERSKNPERIHKWIVRQYARPEPFEVSMDVTALASPEDLGKGLIPSGFPLPDGSLAGKIPAEKRPVVGAGASEMILVTISKDANGKIGYSFEGRARSEVRSEPAEEKPWVNWEDGRKLVRAYVLALFGKGDLQAARAALGAIGGMNAEVSKDGQIDFPGLEGRQAKILIPKGISSQKIAVIMDGDQIYLRADIDDGDSRFYEFVKDRTRYLIVRYPTGLNEVREYAVAYLENNPEKMSKAAAAFLNFPEGFDASVRNKRAHFPRVGKKFGDKYGTIGNIPPGVTKIRILPVVEAEEIYFKVTVSESDVRYFEFSRDNEDYLAVRPEPGMKEIKTYAAALFSRDKTAIEKARNALLKYRDGFEVPVSKGNTVTFPKVNGRTNQLGPLPEEISKIRISVVEEGEILTLKFEIGKSDIRYFDFSDSRENTYLVWRHIPGMKEIHAYAAAFLANDEEKMSVAQTALLKRLKEPTVFKVKSKHLVFPFIGTVGKSLKLYKDIPEVRLQAGLLHEQLFLRLDYGDGKKRYLYFEKSETSYLGLIQAENDEAAVAKMIGQSRNSEKIRQWVLEQYARSEVFEMSMDVTALASPEDLEKGLIPSGFPLPDGSLAGKIPAEKRPVAGAGASEMILVTISKDANGKIGYSFEGQARSELRMEPAEEKPWVNWEDGKELVRSYGEALLTGKNVEKAREALASIAGFDAEVSKGSIRFSTAASKKGVIQQLKGHEKVKIRIVRDGDEIYLKAEIGERDIRFFEFTQDKSTFLLSSWGPGMKRIKKYAEAFLDGADPETLARVQKELEPLSQGFEVPVTPKLRIVFPAASGKQAFLSRIPGDVLRVTVRVVTGNDNEPELRVDVKPGDVRYMRFVKGEGHHNYLMKVREPGMRDIQDYAEAFSKNDTAGLEKAKRALLVFKDGFDAPVSEKGRVVFPVVPGIEETVGQLSDIPEGIKNLKIYPLEGYQGEVYLKIKYTESDIRYMGFTKNRARYLGTRYAAGVNEIFEYGKAFASKEPARIEEEKKKLLKLKDGFDLNFTGVFMLPRIGAQKAKISNTPANIKKARISVREDWGEVYLKIEMGPRTYYWRFVNDEAKYLGLMQAGDDEEASRFLVESSGDQDKIREWLVRQYARLGPFSISIDAAALAVPEDLQRGLIPSGFIFPDGKTLASSIPAERRKLADAQDLQAIRLEISKDDAGKIKFTFTGQARSELRAKDKGEDEGKGEKKKKTKPKMTAKTIFSWDAAEGSLVLEEVQAPQKKSGEISKEIQKQFQDIMKGFDPKVFAALAARYSLDIKNIIWRIVGSRIKGQYDRAKIEQLIDEQLLEMLDSSEENETLGPAKLKDSGGQKPEFLDDVLTGDEIKKMAGNIDKTLNDLMLEPGIDTGLLEIARDQAVGFIRKLEENHFFRTYYNVSPDSFVGQRAKDEIDKILEGEPNSIFKKALEQIRDEIVAANTLQPELHKRGLKPGTNLNLYQLVGVLRMVEKKKILLADEMGLGKTLQSLASFLLADAAEMLVLAPKLALTRWMDDIAKHLNGPLEVVLLADEPVHPDLLKNDKIKVVTFKTAKERYEYLLSERAPPPVGYRRVILMNYELLPYLNTYRKKKKVDSVKIDFLAMDEAHLLKKSGNVTTEAVFGPSKNRKKKDENDKFEGFETKYEQIITGTPLENGPGDLFNFFQRISKGGTSEAERMFQEMDPRKFSVIFRKKDIAKLSALFGFLSERMIRRLKKDVMTGLPEKEILNVHLNPVDGSIRVNGVEIGRLPGNYKPQLQVYETALQNPEEFERTYVRKITTVEKDEAQEVEEAKESGEPKESESPKVEEEPESVVSNRSAIQIMRMGQAAGDPLIFEEDIDGIKADAFVMMLKERLAAGKSVGVFSQFRTITRNLLKRLEKEGLLDQVAYVDGTVKGEDRRQQIAAIQNKEKKIIIATTATMWISIELTQLETLFKIERSWKPTVDNQLDDRAHRYDPVRNYPGKKLEIIYLDYDVPVSIDFIKKRYARRKEILSEMVVNGNLAPEVLAAFRDLDVSIAEQIEEATASPASFDEYELTLAQQLRLLIGKAVTATEPDKSRELWAQIAEIYVQLLEHKGSFFANMASLDHLSGVAYPELKSEVEPKKALDLASGPSTLYRAYERRRSEYQSRNLRLKITDYDATPEMLKGGVKRGKEDQIVGTFEALSKMPGDQYDLINLSFAYRYVTKPKEFFQNIRRMLKDRGIFAMILPPTQMIPKKFYEGLKAMGYEIRVGEGAELESKLDAAAYEDFKRMYGGEFAGDMANQVRGKFSYLVVHKIETEPAPGAADGFTDEDFRLYRPVPEVNEEKFQKIKAAPGEFKMVPDDVFVSGKIEFNDEKRAEIEDASRKNKLFASIRSEYGRINRWIQLWTADTKSAYRLTTITDALIELKEKVERYYGDYGQTDEGKMGRMLDLPKFLGNIENRKWLNFKNEDEDHRKLIQDILDIVEKKTARSELRSESQSGKKWLKWDHARPLIRNYANALITGEGIEEARKALTDIKGFTAQVNKNDKAQFPYIDQRSAVISLPPGMTSLRIRVLSSGGELYLAAEVSKTETRYYEFRISKVRYLKPHYGPNISELHAYAEAFIEEDYERMAAAKAKVLALKPFEAILTDKQFFYLPAVEPRIGKVEMPRGTGKITISTGEYANGQVYLKLEVAPGDFRYYGFSRDKERSYLDPQSAPGIKEVSDYADAFLANDAQKMEAAKVILEKLTGGFDVTAKNQHVFFPRVQGREAYDLLLPAGITSASIKPVISEDEIYLQVQVGPNTRYLAFTSSDRTYLIGRRAPGMQELAEYANAFVSGDMEKIKKAREKLEKLKEPIREKMTSKGSYSFPMAGERSVTITGNPDSQILIEPLIEGEEVLLKVTVDQDVRYYEFSTVSKKSYLNTRPGPGLNEIKNYQEALSGNDQEKIERERKRLEKFTGGFEVAVTSQRRVVFPKVKNRKFHLSNIPAGISKVKIFTAVRDQEAWIRVKISAEDTRYFGFVKGPEKALGALWAKNDEEAFAALIRMSGDKEKVQRWISGQYKREGKFKVTMDVTALAEAEDLEEGLIPSNFPLPDGKLAGEMPKNSRLLDASAKGSSGIRVTITKDEAGKAGFVFEGIKRSELRSPDPSPDKKMVSWNEGRELVREYAKALYSRENLEAAREALTTIEGFETEVGTAHSLTFLFANGRKGEVSFPADVRKAVFRVRESVTGDLYLQVEAAGKETRYVEFRTGKRAYLFSRNAPGMKELQEYAAALIAEDTAAFSAARERFVKYKDGFEASLENQYLYFPKASGGKAAGSRTKMKFPEGISKVRIEVLEDENGLFLKMTGGTKVLRYYEFVKERAYLHQRPEPGMSLLREYAEAFLNEDKDRLAAVSAKLKKFTGGFEVSVTPKGNIHFPKIGDKKGIIAGVAAAKARLTPMIAGDGSLYLKAEADKTRTRYYQFTRTAKGYVERRFGPGQEELRAYAEAVIGKNAGKIKEARISLMKYAGGIEVPVSQARNAALPQVGEMQPVLHAIPEGISSLQLEILEEGDDLLLKFIIGDQQVRYYRFTDETARSTYLRSVIAENDDQAGAVVVEQTGDAEKIRRWILRQYGKQKAFTVTMNITALARPEDLKEGLIPAGFPLPDGKLAGQMPAAAREITKAKDSDGIRVTITKDESGKIGYEFVGLSQWELRKAAEKKWVDWKTGRELVKAYAAAFLKGKGIEKAKRNLIGIEGFEADFTRGQRIAFPYVSGKKARVGEIPPGVSKVRVRVEESEGAPYLKLEVSERDVRYFEFSKEKKALYLVSRDAPGVDEIRKYAEAYLEGDAGKIALAKTALLRFRDGFEVNVTETQRIIFPKAGGKQAQLMAIPSGVSKVRARVEETGGELYLKLEVSEKDVRYLVFSRTNTTSYLAKRLSPGLYEVQKYGEAYLAGDEEKLALAKKALLGFRDGFEVYVTEGRSISFPSVNGEIIQVTDISPDVSKVRVRVGEAGNDLYLKLEISEKDIRYRAFGKNPRRYLSSLNAENDEDALRLIVENSGDAARIQAWIRDRYTYPGAFEASMDVTLLAQPEDLKEGLIPEGFPLPDGRFARELPKAARRLAEAKDSDGIRATITKDPSGKIAYAFEGVKRSELRSETEKKWVSWNEGKELIRRYALALSDNDENQIEAARKALGGIGGFEAVVPGAGVVSFPMIKNKKGNFQNLPPGKTVRIEVIEEKGDVYLKLIVSGEDIRYHGFTQYTKASYLVARSLPGMEEIVEYARANASDDPERLEKARQKLLAKGDFEVSVSKGGKLIFPRAAGNNQISFQNLPSEGRLRIEAGEDGGELYLKLTVSENDVRYFKFSKDISRYLVSRAEPGVYEVGEYAAAYLTGSVRPKAAARERLVQMGSFEMTVTEGGAIVFPVIGEKQARIDELPAGKKVRVEVIREGTEVYLKLVIPESAPRYFGFTKDSKKTYFVSRSEPGMDELAAYAEAYVSGDADKTGKARKKLLEAGSFEVEVSPRGYVHFPQVERKRAQTYNLPAGKKGRVEIKEAGAELYLRLVIPGAEDRYFKFTRDLESYLTVRAPAGMYEIQKYVEARRSGNPELISRARDELKKVESFEASVSPKRMVNFPAVGEKNFSFKKIPAGISKVKIRIMEEGDEPYLKIIFAPDLVKYYRFGGKSDYIAVIRASNDEDAGRILIENSGDKDKIIAWILRQYQKRGPFEMQMNVTPLAQPEDLKEGLIPSAFPLPDGKTAGDIPKTARTLAGAEAADAITVVISKDRAGKIGYAFEAMKRSELRTETEKKWASWEEAKALVRDYAKAYLAGEDIEPARAALMQIAGFDAEPQGKKIRFHTFSGVDGIISLNRIIQKTIPIRILYDGKDIYLRVEAGPKDIRFFEFSKERAGYIAARPAPGIRELHAYGEAFIAGDSLKTKEVEESFISRYSDGVDIDVLSKEAVFFPLINGKSGKIKVPQGVSKIRIYPEKDHTGFFIRIEIQGQKPVYQTFTRDLKSFYLTPRYAPGMEEVYRYAVAYLKSDAEEIKKAAEDLRLAGSFDVEVTAGKGIRFPLVGKKFGTMHKIPDGVQKARIFVREDDGEFYLEVRITDRVTRYVEFTRDSESTYIASRLQPGMKEIQEYAEAFLSSDPGKTASAKEKLKKYSSGFITRNITEARYLNFPSAGGGKFHSLAKIDENVKEGLIEILEDGEGLYLKVTLGEVIRYMAFDKNQKDTYLVARPGPGLKEIVRYGEAFLNDDAEGMKKAGKLLKDIGTFKVPVSAGGSLIFSVVNKKLGVLGKLKSREAEITALGEDDIFLKIKTPGQVNYAFFTDMPTVYLSFFRAVDDDTAAGVVAGQTGKPERLQAWLRNQYERTGEFEVRTDVSLLAEPEDLETGLIPSGFIFPNGKKASEMTASARQLANVAGSERIIVKISKDTTGKIGFEFRGVKRSEVRFDKKLFEGPRQRIFPFSIQTRMMRENIQQLIDQLSGLLGQPVYAEEKGIMAPAPSRILGQDRQNLTAQGLARMAVPGENSYVLLDASWIERLVEKSPRTLYFLLTALEKSSNASTGPRLLLTGDENIYARIAETFRKNQKPFGNQGLNWEEKAEAAHFLDIDKVKKLIEVIPAGGIAAAVQKRGHAVVALADHQDLFEGLVTQFMMDPETVGVEDSVAFGFLVVDLLKAAQWIQGEADLKVQAELIRGRIEELKGVSLQGNTFVVKWESFLKQAVVAERLLETSA